ncbi:MAG: SDR family oxidoreductase [Mariprofundales bacterium]
MNVVITGANRGLGLGFVRHYLSQGDTVWAGFRLHAGALLEMQHTHATRLYLLQWDVCQPLVSMDALPKRIDLLINNAGIYGPSKDGQSFDRVTSELMLQLFAVDCVAPLMVVQQLAPRLIAASGVVANISSKMGSIADNGSGGVYAYRAAKSALVMVSKSMAVDLAENGVHVLTLHPGWVRTDMTNQTGLVDVESSVAGMTSVLAEARGYAAGSFVAFDGQRIPY